MTNGEKYTTAKERGDAFEVWANEHPFRVLANPLRLPFAWLELEAQPEDNPLPCPFCGGECAVATANPPGASVVYCENGRCGYCTPMYDSKAAAVAAHNRVARAAAKGKAGEGGGAAR